MHLVIHSCLVWNHEVLIIEVISHHHLVGGRRRLINEEVIHYRDLGLSNILWHGNIAHGGSSWVFAI